MPEGTTTPASGSEGTGSAPAPDGATSGSDQTPAAGSAAPDAATGQRPEDAGLSAADAKKLRDENAALRRKAREADKAAEDERKAQLSEADRLKEDRAALDRDKATLDDEKRSHKVRTAVAVASSRNGAIYPDAIEAMVVARMSEVEFDAAGAPTNLDSIISEIRKSHPQLFRPGVGSADGGATGRPAPTGGSVNDAIRRAAAGH